MSSIKPQTEKLVQAQKRTYSLDEYLLREQKAVHKHQFINGNIVRIAGAKWNHNLIATNLISELATLLKESDEAFTVLNSDQKIYIESAHVALYPDVLIICGAPIFWKGREDLITNPLVVIEILSDMTQRYDKGNNFTRYKSCETLKEYIVVNQYQTHIESWYRIRENVWENTNQHQIDETFLLRSIGISLQLRSVYRKVIFKN